MFFGAAPFAGFANSYSKPESAPSHALRSPDNPSGTACHLPLHRGGWGILQCATSAYIREGSRFCKIISLEDTPHGSLVPREQSAGTADGGIDGLVQHIKRTTQRLGWALCGSSLFSLQEPTHHACKTGMAYAKNLPPASFRNAPALRGLYFVHNSLDWCDQSPQSVLPIVTFAPL